LLGEALDASHKTDEAIKEFQAAAQLSPKQPDIHFGLGYLYWELQKFDDAAREFEAELSLNSTHAQALAYLGDVELERGNVDRAESLLNKALQASRKLRIVYLDLSKIYMQQNKRAEEIDALKHAIAIDPTQPDAHYRLARAYQATGKEAEARAEFAKSKELRPKPEESPLAKPATNSQP
jgi:tetratricopeptide (TPR) repeat protein